MQVWMDRDRFAMWHTKCHPEVSYLDAVASWERLYWLKGGPPKRWVPDLHPPMVRHCAAAVGTGYVVVHESPGFGIRQICELYINLQGGTQLS